MTRRIKIPGKEPAPVKEQAQSVYAEVVNELMVNCYHQFQEDGRCVNCSNLGFDWGVCDVLVRRALNRLLDFQKQQFVKALYSRGEKGESELFERRHRPCNHEFGNGFGRDATCLRCGCLRSALENDHYAG